MWKELVEHENDWIGGRLIDYGDAVDRKMHQKTLETVIKGFDLSGKTFTVKGKDFNCGGAIEFLDLYSANLVEGGITITGYGGHQFVIVKPSDINVLPDVQASEDKRGITIQKVGVTNLQVPIDIITRPRPSDDAAEDWEHEDEGRAVGTIGKFKVTVEVPKKQKGTHMSHLVRRIMKEYTIPVNLEHLNIVKDELKHVEELHATKAHIEMEFVYWIEKNAPVSKEFGYIPVECKFIVSDYHPNRLVVKTPVMTVCPCSAEMCEGKAHNQRAHVTIEIESEKLVWIEELVLVAESAASSPVHTVLRRLDEKKVVNIAHNKPCFVEDVARGTALLLNTMKYIKWYRIIVESEESIHPHNAYAELEGP